MSIIEAIISGLVQGLTEFLPVSSSGHLSLLQYFTGRGEEAGVLFVVLLHFGTLLSVFIAFWKTIYGLILEFFAILADLLRGKLTLKTDNPRRKMIFLLFVSLLPMLFSLLIADVFTAVATDNGIIVEGVCFILTGLLLFTAVKCVKGKKRAREMTYRNALVIGTFQAVAPMPGISRSGATISAGLLCGLNREYAVAFSFIMGIPTILAANALELTQAVREGAALPSAGVLIAGILTALVFGLIAIRLIRWLVASDKFIYFAWYTFILGVLVIVIGIVERLNGNALQTMVSGMVR